MKKLSLASIAFVGLLLSQSSVAFAQNKSIIDAARSYDIVEIINKGLAYAIIFAGLLSVIFIFVGGISFILSGGQEDKIKK